MQRRFGTSAQRGRAPGVVAAICYLLAFGCLAGALWLGVDYVSDDDPTSTGVAATRYTTTTGYAFSTPRTTQAIGATSVAGAAASPPTTPSDRNGNLRPTIVGPRRLAVGMGSTVTPSGIAVDDEEARGGGELLLLLIGIGVDLHVDLEGGTQFTGPTAAQWLPMVGSIEDLNRTLATLAVTRTEREAGILVYVDDVGNGDPDRSERAEFDIAVVDP